MTDSARPEPFDSGNGSGQGPWKEWARHVLIELERIDDLDTSINDMKRRMTQEIGDLRLDLIREISTLKTELMLLKVKASIWGAAAGAVPVLLSLLVALLLSK